MTEQDLSAIARQMEKLYVSYRQNFVISTNATETNPLGSMYTANRKLTTHDIDMHLAQQYAVCVFAGPRASRFVCFDVDDGSVITVAAVITELVKMGFPHDSIYVSSSGGKGYHVEMFFSDLMYTEDLRKMYAGVIARANLNPKKVEFRPTNTQAIKLPLSKHRKTGNICWFVDSTTLEPICSIDYIMTIKQIDHKEAVALIKDIAPVPKKAVRNPAARLSAVRNFLGRDYPKITEPHTRHDLMFWIAKQNRYCGASEDECVAVLQDWIAEQDMSLVSSSDAEIARDIDDIVAYVYSENFKIIKTYSATDSKYVTNKDILALLAQPTKTKRKLFFLTLRGYKKYGYMQASQEKLAEEVGVKPLCVCKALSEMAKEKWINVVKGNTKRMPEGNFVSLTNRYYPGDDYAKLAVSRLDVDTVPLKISEWQFPTDGNETTWKQDYHNALQAFCTEATLKRYLTAKELEELYGKNK